MKLEYELKHGSAAAVQKTLHNMLYVTLVFGADHSAISQMWQTLATAEESDANVCTIFDFLLFTGSRIKHSDILTLGKRVALFVARTSPQLAVDFLMNELSTTTPELKKRSTAASSCYSTKFAQLAGFSNESSGSSGRNSDSFGARSSFSRLLPSQSSFKRLSRGHFAIVLLSSLATEIMHTFLPYYPALLHQVILGIDFSNKVVFEHCRKLLLHFFDYTYHQLDPVVATLDHHATLPLDAYVQFKQEQHQHIRALLVRIHTVRIFLREHAGRPLWANEDLTINTVMIDSVHTLTTIVQLLVDVLALVNDGYWDQGKLQQAWATESLSWALSCPLPHLRTRSYQVYRALHHFVTIDHKVFLDMFESIRKSIFNWNDKSMAIILETLFTLRLMVEHCSASRLLLSHHVFWGTIALLSTDYEQIYAAALDVFIAMFNKINWSERTAQSVFESSIPTKWVPAFSGVAPLVFRGLLSPALAPTCLELLTRFSVMLPDEPIFHPKRNRIVSAITAILPFLCMHYEQHPTSESSTTSINQQYSTTLTNGSSTTSINESKGSILQPSILLLNGLDLDASTTQSTDLSPNDVFYQAAFDDVLAAKSASKGIVLEAPSSGSGPAHSTSPTRPVHPTISAHTARGTSTLRSLLNEQSKLHTQSSGASTHSFSELYLSQIGKDLAEATCHHGTKSATGDNKLRIGQCYFGIACEKLSSQLTLFAEGLANDHVILWGDNYEPISAMSMTALDRMIQNIVAACDRAQFTQLAMVLSNFRTNYKSVDEFLRSFVPSFLSVLFSSQSENLIQTSSNQTSSSQTSSSQNSSIQNSSSQTSSIQNSSQIGTSTTNDHITDSKDVASSSNTPTKPPSNSSSNKERTGENSDFSFVLGYLFQLLEQGPTLYHFITLQCLKYLLSYDSTASSGIIEAQRNVWLESVTRCMYTQLWQPAFSVIDEIVSSNRLTFEHAETASLRPLADSSFSTCHFENRSINSPGNKATHYALDRLFGPMEAGLKSEMVVPSRFFSDVFDIDRGDFNQLSDDQDETIEDHSDDGLFDSTDNTMSSLLSGEESDFSDLTDDGASTSDDQSSASSTRTTGTLRRARDPLRALAEYQASRSSPPGADNVTMRSARAAAAFGQADSDPNNSDSDDADSMLSSFVGGGFQSILDQLGDDDIDGDDDFSFDEDETKLTFGNRSTDIAQMSFEGMVINSIIRWYKYMNDSPDTQQGNRLFLYLPLAWQLCQRIRDDYQFKHYDYSRVVREPKSKKIVRSNEVAGDVLSNPVFNAPISSEEETLFTQVVDSYENKKTPKFHNAFESNRSRLLNAFSERLMDYLVQKKCVEDLYQVAKESKGRGGEREDVQFVYAVTKLNSILISLYQLHGSIQATINTVLDRKIVDEPKQAEFLSTDIEYIEEFFTTLQQLMGEPSSSSSSNQLN
eukprot:CAMPEP_0201561706 /NCGR_PEP_ID=MMETSP0173_2-20130828/78940_1 /ASSEMBLY_ACC=CAM_ASM_000268 /TAXON_ID=218659 /ORGANISM="Vexillifera sp., Strain DIVA3 564/2" /LENGTH=1424 /DNA_ID=CAMNT_0047976227 /DNA_START=597 /DNA_END=4871 /DNA_ORIENTATION=-